MEQILESSPMAAGLPDTSAFDALLSQHFGIVRKVAASYARTTEDRRDLAQEICLQAWKAFSGYDSERPFSTWLYRIALNVAISSLRAAKPQRHTVSFEDDVAHALEASAEPELDERIELLQRFIARLGPLDRALMLLYLEEHSYREIADVLGISETNVATKISRLKQRVRDDIVHSH